MRAEAAAGPARASARRARRPRPRRSTTRSGTAASQRLPVERPAEQVHGEHRPRPRPDGVATAAGSRFIVTGSTSTSTGTRPASATTFAVAGKVYAGTSTSSPGLEPEREHGEVQRRRA